MTTPGDGGGAAAAALPPQEATGGKKRCVGTRLRGHRRRGTLRKHAGHTVTWRGGWRVAAATPARLPMHTHPSSAALPTPPPNHSRRLPPAARASARAAGTAGPSFHRGPAVATRSIPDKKLRGKLRHGEALAAEAAASAAAAHAWLLPAVPGGLEAEPGTLERTWKVSQAELGTIAEAGAARKAFDLPLPDLGPYSVDYSRSGRFLLLGGRRGHLAVLDWARAAPVCEVFPKEPVRDAVFLHSESFFAAAQARHVYIYDKRGIELHAARDHGGAARLAFLPHHFLLASLADGGVLRYQDTTTGEIVASHRTRPGGGARPVLARNPWNGVLATGAANGVVGMWTPNSNVAVAKVLCHQGPVRAIAVDSQGRHMVTAGADGQVRVWDVRAFKPLHSYFARSPATCLDISQRGLVAVGAGRSVSIWQGMCDPAAKAQSPYMKVDLPSGDLRDAAFCPFDDVLGCGHAGGFTSALIPGAGEPNIDSWVADPYAGRRARREGEVRALLDKLPADSIVLDPDSIGRVAREPREVREERAAAARAAAAAAAVAWEGARALGAAAGPARMKGKNKPTRRQKKKQFVIVEEKKAGLRGRLGGGVSQLSPEERAAKRDAEAAAAVPAGAPAALARFYRRGVD
jgi:U3 small nucleolar RNA-associated protein 7